MSGSMRLLGKPDTWELRVFIGRDSLGKVKHRYVRFRGTRRQAERELARLVVAQDENPVVVTESALAWGSSTTINDAIAAWRGNGWADLSPTTVRHYQELWDRHISSSVGRRAISGLTSYEVEKYFRSLKDAGVGKTTIRHVRAVLHRACKLAGKWSGGRLPNPIAATEMPVWALSEQPDRVRAPSLDEIGRLLAATSEFDARIRAILRLMVATGMRRGEACAIRWSDCDLVVGTVRIDESVVGAKGSAVVKSPKTRASIRSVAIDEESRKELSVLQRIQMELAEASDVAIDADSFVFSFEPGGRTPPHPDSISHAFTRVRSLAAVAADIHLHSLRHFQATALDAVISEKQKQARLGWTNPVMARHYTDSVPEEDRRAAEHIGSLLWGSSETEAISDAEPPQFGQVSKSS